jgi:hypothetical protein
MSGDIGVRSTVGHIDVPFSSLWKNLDAIAPGSADVQYGKFGFHVDGQYAKLATNLNPKGRLIQSGTVELEQAFANFSVSYRVVDDGTFTVDPYIGGRFTYYRLHGVLESAHPRLFPSIDETGSTDWTDPVIGVSARAHVYKPFSVFFTGDVGGFGVASHLTGQAYGGGEVQITRCFYMDLGYRYIYDNYSSSRAEYKINMYGPQITFGLNF